MSSAPQTPVEHDVQKEDTITVREEQSDDGEDIHRDDSMGETSPASGRVEDIGQGEQAPPVEENTDYSLFSNPPALGTMRQRLFDLTEPVELTAAEFDLYFPFVDNVWRKNRGGDMESGGSAITDTYWCRLRTTGSQKPTPSKPPQQGKQQRRKRKREEKTCPMVMKVIYSDASRSKCTITKSVGIDVRHSHDLDYMDQNKRNSGIMDVARREATNGFLPGSVFWKMQEESEKMEEAGGRYMKVSDVRNVQYPWRQNNLSVQLKAHSGYNQQRSGPRSKPLATPTTQPIYQPVQVQPQQVAPAPAPPVAPAPIQQPQQVKPPPPEPGRPPSSTLQYPEHAREFLYPYLPYPSKVSVLRRPHVTLTWATSLDSRIALLPGIQTAISGPETKAMTHFLRSTHDAIVIGVNTAIADDPGLNCRLAGAGGYGGQGLEHQPRPVIIDPHARLHIRPDMRLLQAASDGRALGPWIVVGPGVNLHPTAVSILKKHGGEFLMINDLHPEHGLNWESMFSILYREGIQSVMIEGGGKVLSDLLRPRYSHCIDSVVLTIAPTFFGKSGVQVSPDTSYNEHRQPIATRFVNVRWQPMGESDVVMCAQMRMDPPRPTLPGISEIAQMQPPHQYQRLAPTSPLPPPPPPPPPPLLAAQPRQQHPQLYERGNGTAPPPPHLPPPPTTNADPQRRSS